MLERSRQGFSPQRLGRLRAALQRHVESGQVPGLLALVYHRGLVHAETFGSTTFDGGSPMGRDTIFRLASSTKPITAAGVMILVEECRLRLDDPVDPWLPELSHRRVLRAIDGPLDDTVPAKRAITLRDLLTFRCGYGEMIFLSSTCPLQKAMSEAELPLSTWPFPHSPDEFMKRLGNLPLADAIDDALLKHGIPVQNVRHLLFTFSGNAPDALLTASLQAYPGPINQWGIGLRVEGHAAFIGAVYDRVIANANIA